ncbi:F-actin-monooxygenase MICAL2 [Pelodytes ibericus]
MYENDDDKQSQAGQLFENFIQATTCKGTLQAFNILTRQLELDTNDHRHFYTKLKSKVTNWKAKALWNKLDKRNGHKEYKKGKACINTKCLIIGGGPCGLRTAIELACLGAKVVVVEKRDTFSRNNVLHLWPYTIHDLRCLGAKKFYGKFCAGAIDHISIWQLQLMLFKIALLHGIEIQVNVEFVKLLEPPEDQENQKIGWRAEFLPQDHPLSEYEFDVIIGADGRRNTLEGFRRKEFRGKLAIAITANFINRNTTAEAKVEEISGVAFIFNQKFFQDLKEETGIDLENIVYYKDSTHYFVMTAKKQSLLDKGVIINDYVDAEALLAVENVDQDNLQSYAREAADFATNYQLPSLDFAINHYGQPDVAMFDFTSMYASENAALVRQRHGHLLLVALVGDSLLEPFWPMGTGCARGFLAAFDTAWMVKSWAQGSPPLEIIAEREGLYRLLPQTTPENISKNFDQYTIDPGTRYPNLNSNCVRPHQVKHLLITNELLLCPLQRDNSIRRSVGLSRHESDIRPNKLLTWCQKQTEGYRNVSVTDLTKSWKSGLALCAIIHRFRPELVDFGSLNEEDAVGNNQLAFDIAEKEFGISPITTGKEMSSMEGPDKLSMVLYLSKFYELFRGMPLRPVDSSSKDNGKDEGYLSKPSNLLVNNYLNLTLPRKRVPKVENTTEETDVNKRRRKGLRHFEEPARIPTVSVSSGNECSDTREVINQNKVKNMASQLLAKFEENAPNTSLRRQFQAVARTQPLVRLPARPINGPAAVSRETKPVAKADSKPEFADSTDDLTSLCPSALALSGILERLQHIEEKARQKRAQSLANREFHKKTIKEKAAHLVSLFGCMDFPQNKSPSPGLSHFPSKFPYFDTHAPDPSPPPSPSAAVPTSSLSKKLTVGKVSRGIGAVAEVLVNLYMNDHRPKRKCSEMGSLRKEFPANIGGSDTCYFCKKRVYVVERLSAEGHFFHRECFKCSFCSTGLRLGNYVFNLEEGKFYCQPHFMHSFSSNQTRKRRPQSSRSQEDKTWKREAATAAEVTTDSPCSDSSSDESSPDEPTSPKKSRSDSEFHAVRRRLSSVEWKSVRIAPEAETAENNMLAVRVMVLSDESRHGTGVVVVPWSRKQEWLWFPGHGSRSGCGTLGTEAGVVVVPWAWKQEWLWYPGHRSRSGCGSLGTEAGVVVVPWARKQERLWFRGHESRSGCGSLVTEAGVVVVPLAWKQEWLWFPGHGSRSGCGSLGTEAGVVVVPGHGSRSGCGSLVTEAGVVVVPWARKQEWLWFPGHRSRSGCGSLGTEAGVVVVPWARKQEWLWFPGHGTGVVVVPWARKQEWLWFPGHGSRSGCGTLGTEAGVVVVPWARKQEWLWFLGTEAGVVVVPWSQKQEWLWFPGHGSRSGCGSLGMEAGVVVVPLPGHGSRSGCGSLGTEAGVVVVPWARKQEWLWFPGHGSRSGCGSTPWARKQEWLWFPGHRSRSGCGSLGTEAGVVVVPWAQKQESLWFPGGVSMDGGCSLEVGSGFLWVGSAVGLMSCVDFSSSSDTDDSTYSTYSERTVASKMDQSGNHSNSTQEQTEAGSHDINSSKPRRWRKGQKVMCDISQIPATNLSIQVSTVRGRVGVNIITLSVMDPTVCGRVGVNIITLSVMDPTVCGRVGVNIIILSVMDPTVCGRVGVNIIILSVMDPTVCGRVGVNIITLSVMDPTVCGRVGVNIIILSVMDPTVCGRVGVNIIILSVMDPTVCGRVGVNIIILSVMDPTVCGRVGVNIITLSVMDPTVCGRVGVNIIILSVMDPTVCGRVGVNIIILSVMDPTVCGRVGVNIITFSVMDPTVCGRVGVNIITLSVMDPTVCGRVGVNIITLSAMDPTVCGRVGVNIITLSVMDPTVCGRVGVNIIILSVMDPTVCGRVGVNIIILSVMDPTVCGRVGVNIIILSVMDPTVCGRVGVNIIILSVMDPTVRGRVACPRITVRRSSRAPRWRSPSPPSSPEDEVFCTNDSSEDLTRPAAPSKNGAKSEVAYADIPTYKPHNKALLDNVSYAEPQDHKTQTPAFDRQNSHYSSDLIHDSLSESHKDYHSVFKNGAGQRPTRDLAEAQSNLNNQSLKKLVLSNEEKSSLLDWSIGNPTQAAVCRQEPAASHVESSPVVESESKVTSAFSILSNAIKRSFSRSVSSASETPKHMSLGKDNTVSPSGYISASFFQQSRSNSEYQNSPTDSELDCLSNNPARPTSSPQNHGNGVWRSNGLSHPQKAKQDRLEDFMPKMLEKFSLKETDSNSTHQDVPFRSRRNSFFSSLRLKKPDNSLNASSSDTWSIFASFRKKVSEKKVPEKKKNLFQNSPSKPVPGSPCIGGRMAVSEYHCSSSDDEETKNKRSSSFKVTHRRRMERDARQRAKQAELKRLHKAQTIQRQLQEMEEQQRALEIQGVKLEKALRGEADPGTQDEAQLLHRWFQLALQKDKLNRYESELLCVAKELDLEDQHSRLEQILRERMLIDPSLKDEKDVAEEEEMFAEMMRIVEQRDQLVTHIEEQRLRESAEDKLKTDDPQPSKELKTSFAIPFHKALGLGTALDAFLVPLRHLPDPGYPDTPAAMATSPQKSPSTPKSPTPKSPPSRKKEDSFLGKIGGTLARRKKAKEACFGKVFVNLFACVLSEYARFENGRFVYRISRSPMCEYMINFIHKLKHLPEKYMMNSVLENFTILLVVTNRDTQETLLCMACVFEVSNSEHGAQHHIYRLVKE